MILSSKFYRQLTWQIGVLGLAFSVTVASDEPQNQGTVDRLPLSVEPVGSPRTRPVSTSVKWEGREYDIESGIPVLMGVVRNSEKSAEDRNYALMRLVMLGSQLGDRPFVAELVGLYDDAGELKGGILLCLAASDDPRGIPIFVRALEEEKDIKWRLRAAAALAQWNIRRGVAELVALLDSDAVLPELGRIPYVRDNALDLFRTKNRLKGWGFPQKEWWKPIDERADLNEDEKRALYNAEIDNEIKQIKKWWAENKDRFPEWNSGDPLPEVPQSDKKSSGE